jgi:hypothetical protein
MLPRDVTRALVVGSYAILGSVLAWSRLIRLDRGYCCDEVATVVDYVRAGPDAILAGSYAPNNHKLYSLVGWATSAALGESEIALRLWAAVPFIAGAIVVTAWLHVRLGPLSGVLFLFFATVSPLLLDLTREARGYGLAFLAMSVMIVTALETLRSPRTSMTLAFFVSGVVGTWTLPHFGIAFACTGAVLLTKAHDRVGWAGGLGLSLVAAAAPYAMQLDDIVTTSSQPYGAPIDNAWAITAPLDQTLIPALIYIDEVFLRPALGSAVVVVALAVLIGSSPLMRSWGSALILGTGVVATVAAFWATGTYVVPRFFSFLLVPLLMLLASGIAAILASSVASRRPGARTLLAVMTLGGVTLIATPLMVKITRLPRVAAAEAAAAIRSRTPLSTPVFVYMPYPRDFQFHFGPMQTARTPQQLRRVCNAPREVVFVRQQWPLPSATARCTRRAGTRQIRIEQYARGGEIDLWFIPPDPRS